MRKWLLLILTALPSLSYAGGFTQWAVPTRVDVVRNEGIMVYGSFGNPNGCTNADQIFIPLGHTQYNEIYALVMLAFTTGRAVQSYADQCAKQEWYSDSYTYNQLDPCCSIYIGS